MKINTEIVYSPTPAELAIELWEQDAEYQADFLQMFLLQVPDRRADIIYQLDSITKKLQLMDTSDKNDISWLLSDFADRIINYSK